MEETHRRRHVRRVRPCAFVAQSYDVRTLHASAAPRSAGAPGRDPEKAAGGVMAIDTKELAKRVLEHLRDELPEGLAKSIVLTTLDGSLRNGLGPEGLFARMMLDHGYTFEDALAGFEAVRQLETAV
jgi:hypothetical protein